MDEALKALCLAVMMAIASGVGAQGLPDPTRPPASLLRGTGGGAVDSAPTAPALPQLQSILIAPHEGGRHVAVIDGQTLRLGDTYKGAVLASVTPTGVVLKTGNKRQVLKLFPAVPSR